jgi:hypothetical protein
VHESSSRAGQTQRLCVDLLTSVGTLTYLTSDLSPFTDSLARTRQGHSELVHQSEDWAVAHRATRGVMEVGAGIERGAGGRQGAL